MKSISKTEIETEEELSTDVTIPDVEEDRHNSFVKLVNDLDFPTVTKQAMINWSANRKDRPEPKLPFLPTKLNFKNIADIFPQVKDVQTQQELSGDVTIPDVEVDDKSCIKSVSVPELPPLPISGFPEDIIYGLPEGIHIL